MLVIIFYYFNSLFYSSDSFTLVFQTQNECAEVQRIVDDLKDEAEPGAEQQSTGVVPHYLFFPFFVMVYLAAANDGAGGAVFAGSCNAAVEAHAQGLSVFHENCSINSH